MVDDGRKDGRMTTDGGADAREYVYYKLCCTIFLIHRPTS